MHLCISINQARNNMYKLSYYIFFILYFFHINALKAQVISPFSSLNSIGEISDNSYANNLSMGGLGISNGSYWHLNSQNPAALVYNGFTNFEMGIRSDIRQIVNDISKDVTGNGNINYMGFGIPIVKDGKWVMSIGFNPYSNMSFKLFDQDQIENVSGGLTSALVNYEYQGEGGLTEVYFSNGIKLSKDLSFGLKGSYIFGKITSNTSSSISNEPQFYSNLFERSIYNDYSLTSGVFYKNEISDNTFIKVGFIYDIKSSLEAERFSQLERKIPNSLSVVVIDTILNNEVDNFIIPKSYGFGVSYEVLDKISFGAEFRIQPWNKGSGFSENSNANYKNSLQVSTGMELIPDAENVNSFFKRVTYRGGIIYKSYPYLINGGNINNIALTFGLSLPVGTISRINLGFEAGKRGNIKNNLIKENYLKFIIGTSINNIWFIKRKFD